MACRTWRREMRRAVTLLELIVVMSILMILMGIVGYIFIKPDPPPEASDIQLISIALDQYHLDNRCYPPDTGYGLRMESGSPHYDPGSLWRYLVQRTKDPKTGHYREPCLEWPQDKLEPYDDPLRGKSFYVTDPYGNPFGFVASKLRRRHSAAFDLFSAGRDGVTACNEDPQDPSDTSPDANKAYNGKDDDGNGVVDDWGEFGPKAKDNGNVGDDTNNW